MAPDREAAFWAARDLLTLAAVGRCIDELGLACDERQTIRLDHRIQGERGAGLALAPAAVAAVHEERLRLHAIPHPLAVAAAFERERHRKAKHTASPTCTVPSRSTRA